MTWLVILDKIRKFHTFFGIKFEIRHFGSIERLTYLKFRAKISNFGQKNQISVIFVIEFLKIENGLFLCLVKDLTFDKVLLVLERR